jgi:hypothetical protein
VDDESYAEFIDDLQARLAADVFAHSQHSRALKRKKSESERSDDDEEGPEVVYVQE